MSGPQIRVEGVRELTRALKDLGDRELSDALRAAHKTISEEVVKKALPHVPVRTGRLRASVKALGTQRAATVKAGNSKVKYAPVIEYGAGPRKGKRGPHNIKGRKFLTNAAATVGDQAKATYLEEINRIIRKAGLA